MQDQFSVVKNELENWTKNTNDNSFEQVILKEESQKEQFPLHSIAFRKDGSMFIYYTIEADP